MRTKSSIYNVVQNRATTESITFTRLKLNLETNSLFFTSNTSLTQAFCFEALEMYYKSRELIKRRAFH